MFERLRKISMKTAVLMGICFYSLTILIHTLILSGIIPLTWINGGRSESFDTQLPLSIIGIIISIIGVVFTLNVGGALLNTYKRSVTLICWLFVSLWFFGFIQQLLGTPFEKMICSLILVLGIISNLRMAIEKR
ncbi:hypothetical protein MZM54_00340 [[Brevibacterium] frigoritolerans]|nr:hypothetical protein [Peribacillus frigoritolerans]